MSSLSRGGPLESGTLTSDMLFWTPRPVNEEPASRGDFDGVVVKQVEDELQKRLGHTWVFEAVLGS